MDDIGTMKKNIENLRKENASLKNQIQLLKEKENSYQTSILRIKKIQSEYESSYAESINDYKKHEEEIKKKYFEYQKVLEKQNEENERRLNEEIILLKNELKEKDSLINTLSKKTHSLNEKITKDELNYYFKEKEYEDIITSKERKLTEMNEAIKQIVQEATEEIKRLSQQLEDFQNRNKINNPMSLLIEKETIENNYINNLNRSVDYARTNNINTNKSLKQNDIIKQSQNIINNSVLLSDNYKNVLKEGNTPERVFNNSVMLTNKYNNPMNDINNPLF
jgi:chromosome segregation ATPase